MTHDTETLNFNTAISQMMVYSNELARFASGQGDRKVPVSLWEPFVQMIACYAPHLGEELWQRLGHKESIAYSKWPEYDENLCKDEEKTVVLQVNGKVRDKMQVPAGTSKEELEKQGLALPGARKWLEGKTIVKVIVVADKLVNVVVK